MNKLNRDRRHLRLRKKISGSPERPRLAVFRSNKFIYAQIIDDSKNITIAAESDFKGILKGKKTDRSFEVGKKLAVKARKIGIKKIVFDRGGFLYHGRIKKLADGLRDGGLEF